MPGMSIMSLAQNMSRDKAHLKAACSQNAQEMKQLNRLRSQLALRRSHLIRDLAIIYPIVQVWS